MVDGVTTGSVTGGMKLRFLTVATDAVEKSELRLMTESKGQAIVVLSESPYYENLESAMQEIFFSYKSCETLCIGWPDDPAQRQLNIATDHRKEGCYPNG